MKLVISLLVIVLVVSIDALPSQQLQRSKRGFRMGAANRFSHGFGKRTDTGLDNMLSEAAENRWVERIIEEKRRS